MDTSGRIEAMGPSMTVRFVRDVAASPEKVWEALTSPAVLEGWLAVATFEPKEGGAVHLSWPEGNGEMHGVVLTWQPTTELEYSWSEVRHSMLRFELAANGGGTTLQLVHAGVDPDEAAGFGAGWQSHLEALDTVLGGGTSTSADRDARYAALRPLYDAMVKTP